MEATYTKQEITTAIANATNIKKAIKTSSLFTPNKKYTWNEVNNLLYFGQRWPVPQILAFRKNLIK